MTQYKLTRYTPGFVDTDEVRDKGIFDTLEEAQQAAGHLGGVDNSCVITWEGIGGSKKSPIEWYRMAEDNDGNRWVTYIITKVMNKLPDVSAYYAVLSMNDSIIGSAYVRGNWVYLDFLNGYIKYPRPSPALRFVEVPLDGYLQTEWLLRSFPNHNRGRTPTSIVNDLYGASIDDGR